MYDEINKMDTTSDVKEKLNCRLQNIFEIIKSENQRNLYLKMLSNYTFLDESHFKNVVIDYCYKLKEYVVDKKIEDCCFALPIVDSKTHNSLLLSGVLKTALKNENVYTSCLYDIDKKHNLKHIFLPGLYENMILMDDYSGSGETFVGALECIMNAINNEKNTIKLKKIYLSAIRYSKVAIEKIEQAKSNYNFEVEFIKLNTEYTGYEINQDEQDTFEQLNNDIYIKEEYKRGYAQCKDLYSTVYSTPNNTYGMFWYGGKYSTNLFDRNYGISQNMFFKEVLEKLNSCIKCKNKMDCEIIALKYLKYSIIDILKITQCDTKKYIIAINYAQSQRILKSDFTPDVNFDKFFVKANLDSLYSNEHVKNEIEQKLDSLANT